MFSCKKTFKIQTGLCAIYIVLGVLSCPPYSYAQEVSSDTESDSRHIDRLGEGSSEEWQMDLALPAATSVGNSATSLPDAEQDQQLQQLLSSLAANPDSSRILGQLNGLLRDVLVQADVLMDENSIDEARQLLSLVQSVDPSIRGLNSANTRLVVLREVSDLLTLGDIALDAQKLIEPANDNALYYYRNALQKNPENKAIKTAIINVEAALIIRAEESSEDLDFEMAAEWLAQASAVREEQSQVNAAWAGLNAAQSGHADELEAKALAAMDAGSFNLAEFNIIDLIALGNQEERVQTLRARLEDARLYGGFEPGQVITDEFLRSDGLAPSIVIIPSGSFLMGSGGRSGGAYDNEQPRHRVTIERGFGLGIKEVTVEEFGLFVSTSGYVTSAERAGRSTIYDESAGRLSKRNGISWKNDFQGDDANPDDPVIHVNFHDANAYVEWLAVETGKHYRLPTEAEFEYVATAAGNGTYWWGEGSPDETVENITGQRDKSRSKRRWTTPFKKYGDGYWGPAPAGSFRVDEMLHPMGVQDIAGNVSEWTADCWHSNYMQAPVDGSAWVNPGCERTVVRGGYWASAPQQTRAAFRISAKPETLGPVVGIRIARDL